MAVVYSVKFLAYKGLFGELVYTVPVGKVAILRDVDVYGGGVITFSQLFLEDSDTGGAITQWVSSEGNAFAGIWRGRQVFAAGEGFKFRSPLTEWDVRASGYLLNAP